MSEYRTEHTAVRTSDRTSDRIARRAAAAVAAVLTADGLLHVFWSSGRTWPAHDARSLSYGVLGADVPFTPPIVLPLAAMLFTAAALVVGRARLGRAHRWGRMLQAGTVAVAAAVGVRAEGRATRSRLSARVAERG